MDAMSYTGRLSELMGNVMTYFVQPEAMAKRLALESLVELCLPAANELVVRYGLQGANLMSVGAGGANEEIALLKAGMRRAFLFDIDEHNTLSSILPVLHDPAARDAPIVYVLDDFTKTQPAQGGMDPIQVLYFSGFTPDEQRRGVFRTAHIEAMQLNRLRSLLPFQPKLDPNWPPETNPLHDVVLAAIDGYLEDNGYFVLQSYCDGVDALWNPGYVTQWQRSLSERNVELLEGYAFKAAPGVTLWVGVKLLPNADKPASARVAEIRKRLETRAPLTQFHGRAQLDDKTIVQFFPSQKAR